MVLTNIVAWQGHFSCARLELVPPSRGERRPFADQVSEPGRGAAAPRARAPPQAAERGRSTLTPLRG